jgi:fibronectin type 3 domain-containing protein
MTMTKFIPVTVLMILVSLAGCDRYLDSSDPVRSLPSDVSIPINLEAVIDDASVTLRWELTDSSDVARFRIYVADDENGEYILRDSTSSYSATLDNLLLNQQHYFRVTTVTTTGLESSPSETVSATAVHLSISINNDSEYTRQRDVQVQIYTGVAAAYVQLSEEADFSDAIWESFGSTKSFELSEDDGVKTVYVRMQYADGSETGASLSDDITLDTYAEITSVTFQPQSDTLKVGQTTTFKVDAGETGGEASVSFESVRDFELHDDGIDGDVIADDGVYSGTYTVPHGVNALDAMVTGSFTDVAGNRAEGLVSESLLNINMPPVSVTLAADTNSVGSTVIFTWTISNESDFESYRLYRDNSGTSPSDDKLVTIITSAATNQYETSMPSTTTPYSLFVFDRHGESAGSNVVTISVSP